MLPQWLRGGPGDDVLVGGGGAEWLWGDAGADQLSGRGGDDSLQGGAGDDAMTGGVGNDGLSGGAGNDTMTGGVGNDDLSGGGGRDHIRGGAGDDSLDGGYARDVLLAGPGTDACNGGLGVTDFAGCEHIEPVVIGPAEELHLAERRWGAHRGARYRWEYGLGEPGSVIDYCTRSRVGTSNTGPIPAGCVRGATVEAMFDVIKLASGWTFVREVRYDELTGRPTYVDAARGVQLREQGFRFLD
ncbi:MAG: hypothetical protein OES57_10110 [Acidimicrobiia bacterium]|nr:hypothetical protein [Acidimicrobiia bacterium]